MNDVDRRLRDAGAGLRDTAPSAAATEAALAALGDVQLDDERGSGRRRMWIVAPAVLAAAAVVVGVIVMTRPDQQAVVPADTTIAPAPTTVPTVVVPSTTLVPEPSTTATTVGPSTTTSTIVAGTDLGFGVTLAASNENFDGDGGACLTLSTSTDNASGCASGATMRSAFGHPLALRLDGTAYWYFPSGGDGSGQPDLVTAGSECFAEADLPGTLVEDAGCGSDGIGILGVLPASPDGATTWTIAGAQSDGIGIDVLAESEDLDARAFRAPGPESSGSCVVVAVSRNNSVREACGIPGRTVYLAGSTDSPLVVTHDNDAGTATLDPLDPVTTLDANDCADLTSGELVALLPEHGMAGALLCGADVGAVWVPPELVDPRFVETAWDILARDAGGSWSVSASEVDYTCTEGIAAEACAALGVFDLGQSPQFPSVESIEGFEAAVGDGAPLPGRPAIEEIPSLEPAADLATLAEAAVTALRAAADDPDQTFEVYSDSSPIVIRRTNLDDSLTATVFVLATGTVERGVVVVSNGTRAVDICGRGTTTVDGAPVCV